MSEPRFARPALWEDVLDLARRFNRHGARYVHETSRKISSSVSQRISRAGGIATARNASNDKPEVTLRGKGLAEAWKQISDATLKARAKADIKARWQSGGWWDNPPGRTTVAKPKTIYMLAGLRLIERDSLGDSGSRGYGKVKFTGLKLDGQPLELPKDRFITGE